MPNISMTMPTDWNAQQADIERQRKLAELLQQQSMQPIETSGYQGMQAPISWTQGLAKMMQAYMGSEGQKKATEQSKALGQDYQRTGQEALARGLEAYRGTPAVPEIPAPSAELGGGPGAPAQPAIPGSPDAAIAAFGGHPATQGLSQALLAQMLKGEEPYSLKQGEQRMKGNQVIATNAPKPTEHVINDKIYRVDPTTNKLVEIGGPGKPKDYNKPFSDDGTPNPAYQAYELKKAERGSIKVPISVSTEKKYGEQFAGKVAESDVSLMDSARKAPDLADRANRIKDILSKGNAITGFGANFRLEFGKAASLAGLSYAQEAAANTETLAASLAQNTMDAIKASGMGGGTGFSNADRDFLEKAVGGKITLEAPAISRLADLAHRAASMSAQKWNKRVKEIPGDAIKGTGIDSSPVNVSPLFGSTPTDGAQLPTVPTATGPNGQKLYLRNGQWSPQ